MLSHKSGTYLTEPMASPMGARGDLTPEPVCKASPHPQELLSPFPWPSLLSLFPLKKVFHPHYVPLHQDTFIWCRQGVSLCMTSDLYKNAVLEGYWGMHNSTAVGKFSVGGSLYRGFPVGSKDSCMHGIFNSKHTKPTKIVHMHEIWSLSTNWKPAISMDDACCVHTATASAPEC